MKSLSSSRRLSGATAAVLATGAVAAGPAVANAAAAKTLYVTTKGHNKTCTQKKPCRTISYAVARAKPGAAVFVSNGTYKESVKITKRIALLGSGATVINAKGKLTGVLIAGPKADGAEADGLVVENATEEGILATRTSGVIIAADTLVGNDRGFGAKKPVGECAPQGATPGDCGEGLHLMSVTHARLLADISKDNTGGILITDELGPSSDNLLYNNRAVDNAEACGITLAGHNTGAYVSGQLRPAAGGVFNNIIVDNTANDNGLKALGAGILIAAGAPGSAVYGNTVQDNTANGNGLGGFTLHSHSPGQYFDDNRIVDNKFMDDGVAGNPGGKPGDVDAGITQTVGIIVYSAVTELSGTVISGNNLGDEYYGIWTQNVPQISQSANNFGPGVTIDVSQR